MALRILIISIFLLTIGSCKQDPDAGRTIAANALDGSPLYFNPPSVELEQKYQDRKASYLMNVHNMDNLIWYGRFAAYTGRYDEAFQLYSAGIERSPRDARFFRHRGHRYITTRQFDKAISDFEKAKTLIRGIENSVEPDGMPNAQNIPVSTKHGNIYYHLGLAYYLKNENQKALDNFLLALESASMSDNIVSCTHWIYMILRKMGRSEEAAEALKPISKDMEIIENQSYHYLCLFYKGGYTEADLLRLSPGGTANDAIRYGIANWYLYNNRNVKGIENMHQLVQGDSWTSFGYIAAEAELYSRKQNNKYQ